MAQELVSIVVPAARRLGLLRETIQSLRQQSWDNWECLLVPEHSVGKGNPDLRKCVAIDDRVRLCHKVGRVSGAPASRNYGLDCAAGEFVLFLDSDDILANNAIAKRVEALRGNPAVGMAVGSAELFVTEPGDLGILFNTCLGERSLSRFLLHDYPWQTMCPLWRTEVARGLRWNEKLGCGQDVELHTRAILSGVHIEFLQSVDCYYRKELGGESLGSNPFRFDRLKDLGARLREVRDLIAECGYEMSEGEWRAAAAGELWHCICVARHGEIGVALSLWQEYASIYSLEVGSLGQRLLECQSICRDVRLRRQVRAAWPEALMVGHSPTLGVLPAPDSVESGKGAEREPWCYIHGRGLLAYGRTYRAVAAATKQCIRKPFRLRPVFHLVRATWYMLTELGLRSRIASVLPG